MKWMIVLGVLLVLCILFFIRSEYEKRSLQLRQYEVESGKLPGAFDGFRMLYLADLHSVSFGEKNRRLVETVREAKPDLILLGGDMVTVKPGRPVDLGAFGDLLKGLRGIPVYYGPGNHEERLFSGERYRKEREQFLKLLAENGVVLLRDEGIDLYRENGKIRLSGLSMTPEQGRKLRKITLPETYIRDRVGEPEGYQVLLYHSPLFIREMAAWGADLAFYGHFHGGTVRLPLLGGLMTPQIQFFYPYCRGQFRFGDRCGIVSGGLGTHSIRIRFMNKPEPVLAVLRRKERA